ncbi:hypothetical protein [Pseudomonas sp. D1-36]|uniref:hypothetical protein n=1 Tax=Pseudomonas sp. D1-36 TaxID=2817387 RepID=UPI003DA84631
MNDATDSTPPANNDLIERLLSQFRFLPLSVLYEQFKSLDTTEYAEALNALIEKNKKNDEVDRKIQAWEQEKIRQDKTRLLVKIFNHTDQAFQFRENNLNLNAIDHDFFNIRRGDIQALKFDFSYVRTLRSRSKDMFQHFIVFGDKQCGFRFDFGLRVETSFGVFTPTLTPVRTLNVTSIGATPVNCTTRITHAAEGEPYGFTVEIVIS